MSPQHPQSRPRRTSRIRLLGSEGLLCGLVLAFGMALSAGADTPGLPDVPRPEALLDAPDWRARGLAHVDLPLQLRARFDARDGRWASRAARLASPHATGVGPGVIRERAIESRFALSRPIAGRLELEISWRTQNRLSGGDPMSFGTQIVGALIRFTP